MDSKIGVIAKLWSQRKEAFGNSCVTIVDANGNRLLDHIVNGNSNIHFQEKVSREICSVPREIEANLNEQNEIRNGAKAFSKFANLVSKEDITLISALLETNKHQIFTAKLNKSNYICFINGHGLLICRGKFNMLKQDETVCLMAAENERRSHDKHLDDSSTRPIPMLVASKVSGLLTVVTGESSSAESIVDVVKEIARILKDS